MRDLMLDIETLGTRPTSVITQLGACYFDRHTGKIGDTFLQNIDVDNCLSWGLTMDWQTIQWWMGQPNKSWMGDPQLLTKVLGDFTHFVSNKCYVWSHSTFDIPILLNAYVVTKRNKLPFHYRATRDIRTLTHLSGISKNEIANFKSQHDDEKTHNALEDCLYQVKYCVDCFKKIKHD